tara:strand:- start:255 stop:593 length:339 start_codon:yes stop_codon:yes gene_type:complete
MFSFLYSFIAMDYYTIFLDKKKQFKIINVNNFLLINVDIYIYMLAPPHSSSHRILPPPHTAARRADGGGRLNAQASRINTQPPKAEIAEGCGCPCVCESLINSQPAEDSLSR